MGHDNPEHDPRHGQPSTDQKQETVAVCGLFSFGLLPQVQPVAMKSCPKTIQ